HHSPDLAAFARSLIEHAAGKALLESVFGNSPFLTQCCLREVGLLSSMLERGPDATFAELLDALNWQCRERAGDASSDTASLMRALRVAKRRAALLVGLADMAGCWSLDRVTAALSDLADACLAAAVRHLLGKAAGAGEIDPAGDGERDCGL